MAARTVMRMLAAALCVAASGRASEITLFDGGPPPAVAYEASDGAPIAHAAALLAGDLRSLTGRDPEVVPAVERGRGTAVIIGRADSPAIAALLRSNGISDAPIRGKWETYGRAVVPAPWGGGRKALLIFGSDVRGTVWGVIDLTREMGVSPWEWWADVTPRKTARIAVAADLRYSREPTVKYRGVFLNGGQSGLEPWAERVDDPAHRGLGPKTYARIFELLWRLKANTIWPYMGEFNDDPANYRTAADYAIVRGSSHVEMLLRTNGTEWGPARGAYNWFTNRQGMIGYWTEAVRRWGGYDNLYTVGLRDKDDFPMEGVKTTAEVGAALTDVIAAQRKILSGTLGRPAERIPQVLTLYKEVLPAYMSGRLRVPDDVTLIWPEDDFGYVRQLSDPRQRLRSGGSGVYYHTNFWGPPMSYLWVPALNPALMWEEMAKAARFQARRIWILNVGSIKPSEFPIQLFLAMAFDADAFPDGGSVREYLRSWAAECFGPRPAGAIADLLGRYYQLSFDRQAEFMAWTEVFPESSVAQTKFNAVAFGDENARRAAAYRALMGEAKAIMASLPADRRDAFYELVRYPVDIAGDLNLRQLDLDKSILYGLQHRASATVYGEEALAAQADALADTRYYDERLAGGKWRGWMDARHKDLPVFETPQAPAWTAGGEVRWGVQAEGGEYLDSPSWWMSDLPLFHPELPVSHYVDVFVSAPVAATWTARPSVPWIKLDRESGAFSPATKTFEARIQVSIDWARAPAGEALPQLGVVRDVRGTTGDVVIACSAGTEPYRVHVVIAPPNRVPGVSFIEADRIVSLYAVHPDACSGPWEKIEGLGHVGVGAAMRTPLAMRSVDPGDAAAVRRAPSLSYRFATTTADDPAQLAVVALPTFPITDENGVRVGISLDGGPPQVLDLAAPEYSQRWRQNVLANTAVGTVGNLRLEPGGHVLTVYALDPGIVLDRFELSFAGAQRAYGAVPETKIK
ncbi:MAG TPA: glycosyl hydrolase 115 family protein [Opitutaceae bacterium]|nr:glycosyl hydrolase 115 family protein [Opitutaceae bacterium]